MQYAVIGKLVVEAVAAAAVLFAAVLFLKDRRAARAAELRDRAGERSALHQLVENAIAHNTAAVDANTQQQRRAAEALARLAASIESLTGQLATRPCLLERKPTQDA